MNGRALPTSWYYTNHNGRYETKVHTNLYESPIWRTYVILEELLVKVHSSTFSWI